MTIREHSPQALTEAVRVLAAGGIVAHPTETCYGLACDLTNPDAVRKLFTLKKRPPDQPVSALFASIEQAKQYVEWSEKADGLAEQFLPGPLTIILPMRANTPFRLYPSISRSPEIEARSWIGVRLSPHPVARSLVEAFGRPISTTSANLHGQPEPYSVAELLEQFPAGQPQPDLLIDSGTLQRQPPSTVVRIEGEKIHLVRKGSTEIDKLYNLT